MAFQPEATPTGIAPLVTIYNGAASQKTLSIMRWMAFCGMPFVITYTATVYWVFRGKVQIGKLSY